MNCYMLIYHLDSDEIKGTGTMSSMGTVYAKDDADALQQIVDHFGIKVPMKDLSTDWRIENCEYSVVKLVPITPDIVVK